jgi:hypothetical protein
LACISCPSSMSMILRFDVLVGLLSSCISLSQLLSCLTKSSSVLFNFYFIFKLWDSVFHCSNLLEWPSTVFFVWLKGVFISRISVWFFFSEVFHIFVQLLFYILCCLLYFTYCFYL